MDTHDATIIHPELHVHYPVEEEARAYRARHLMAVTRISLGLTFLWAFLDKTVGLGFATAAEDAWIRGGSPTFGYLNFATEGKWLHHTFADIAGPAADWLFMVGLLGVGLAFVLGIGMRIGAGAGATLLVLMWLASLPLENNPLLDDHLIHALAMVALTVFGAGRTWGLGRWWGDLKLVQKLPFLI